MPQSYGIELWQKGDILGGLPRRGTMMWAGVFDVTLRGE